MSCINPESCITIVFAEQEDGSLHTMVTPSIVLESLKDGQVTLQPPPSASFRFLFNSIPGGGIAVEGLSSHTGMGSAEFCCEASALAQGLTLTVTVRFASRETVWVVRIKRPYPKDVTPPAPGTGSAAVTIHPVNSVSS